MFVGMYKYVFGPTQTHFSASVARVKISSEECQRYIYAQERQLYYYYNNFKGCSKSSTPHFTPH